MREAEAIAACVTAVPSAQAIRGPGDDAAVLEPVGGNLVWATDLMLEGRHFRLELSSLADAAFKAVARNASDLAAMGAEPVAFLAAVALPEADDARVQAVADGLREAAEAFDLPVAGGDLSRDDRVVFAISVLGRVPGAGIGRDGARIGDLLAVTGRLGGAAAGLALLDRAHRGDPQAVELLDRFPQLAARHRRGVARLAAGVALRGIAHAAIDVSDGLAADARRIADASGVRCVLDPGAVPHDEGVAEAAALAGVPAEAFSVRSGDDYELLVALGSDDLERARDAIAPLPFTVIGRVEAGAGLVAGDGTPIEGGHDPFA